MKSWYYYASGKQNGPIPETQLVALFQSGSISAKTLVWTEGMKEWQEARTIENLVPPSIAPPPVPPAAVAPPPTFDHDSGSCPLCGNGEHMAKAQSLYGHLVCKKCYYSFANKRQLAYFLDVMGWWAITAVIGLLVGIVLSVLGWSPSKLQSVATPLAWMLIPLLLCKDCFAGQSLGKAICGVQVIDETTGAPGGINASLKRNLPLVIPFVPLLVAFQLCKGYRTGDGWSNTKVERNRFADEDSEEDAEIRIRDSEQEERKTVSRRLLRSGFCVWAGID